MWYLSSESDERIIFISPPNVKVTIGRIVDPLTTISFPEDNSISRKHATLILRDGKLLLIDLDSKYGTFIYENKENSQMVKLTNNVEKSLSNGDKIKFGILKCIWNVHELNFVTCASTVKGENLQILKSSVESIGGTLKTEWDETCSFLTMPAITVTIKVVLALAQGAHIVGLDFWKDCREAITNKKVPPNPKDYLPEVIESTLNRDMVSFHPNLNRKTIFAGKKFVFFSRRQWELYNPVLKICSGVGLLLGEQKLTKSMLCAKDVTVVQYAVCNTTQESQAQQNQINGIVTFLKAKGKRLVVEAEIGLAVLYCSTDKYCNPDFNFSSEVLQQNVTDSSKPPNILALESQDTNKMELGVKDNVLINETLTPNKQSLENTNSAKRKINDIDIGDENPHKKIAREEIHCNKGSKELFDFIEQGTNTGNANEATDNRLNFAKPSKRKSDFDTNNEDDLFNFVPTKKEKIDDEYNENKTSVFEMSNKPETVASIKEEIPLFEIRGLSIKELVENSAACWKSSDMIVIDDDVPNELEERMGDLSLGITIVTVNKNLVRERTDTFEVVDQESGVKNFKKFKKVWPIKMQVTVIPKSRMSIVKPDVSNIGYIPGDSDTDDEVIPVESVPKFKKHSVKIENF